MELNGKKTWLGLALSSAAVVFATIGKALQGETVSSAEIAQALGAVSVLVGAIHKLKKGE